MIKRIVLIMVAICFVVGLAYAKNYKEDFEKGSLKGWEIEGDAKIDSTQKHGGTKSLMMPAGSKAIWSVETDNKYGTMSMWVYISRVGKGFKGNMNGPNFGATNADGDFLVIGFVQRTDGNHPWGEFYSCSSLDSIYAWWHPGLISTAGWHRFDFDFSDKTTMTVLEDESKAGNIDVEKAQFTAGFTGVILSGGQASDNPETFFYDDIEIKMK